MSNIHYFSNVVDEKNMKLIFYHKVQNAEDLFINDDEARSSNTQNKYSILENIEKNQERYKILDMFEFLLIFPEKNGCNHWRQKLFPTQANPKEENGFIDLGSTYNDNYWKGLSKSSAYQVTYIDGSPEVDSWYFPIGLKHQYDGKYCIPEPTNSIQNGSHCISEIMLYIRIPNRVTCQKSFIILKTVTLIGYTPFIL